MRGAAAPAAPSGRNGAQDGARAIRASGLLDARWYLARYRDVAMLRMEPAEHYLRFGARMGRDPGPGFSTRFHLDLHPELVRSGENPLLHRLRLRGEGPPPPDPERERNPVWAADRLLGRDPTLALALAREALPADLHHTIEILRANAAAGDEARWLGHLNAYLEALGAAPVHLAPEGASRFHRLRCDVPPAPAEGPLVTVILAAWNAERTVAAAMRSILAQSWRPLELLAVDDASTDATFAAMRAVAEADPRVRVLRNTRNVGPFVSKNVALAMARGEWVTGHDADDWAHPQRIEHHVAFARREGLRAGSVQMLRMGPDHRFTKLSRRRADTLDGVARRAMISCLFERAALRDRLGYWDAVRFGGDAEMVRRAELALGPAARDAPILGLICLDQQTSLTNHPEHGVWAREGAAPPTIRKNYRRHYLGWHARIDPAGAYLPFPHAPRRFEAPPAMLNDPATVDLLLRDHAAAGAPLVLRPSFECDLCIATNLRFPGGNASSTLDELRVLTGEGRDVILLHVPIDSTKRRPLAERYAPWVDLVKDADRFERIRARRLVLRGPRMVASPEFEPLRARLSAERLDVIVNNALVRPATGEAVYALDRLVDATLAVACERAVVHPLSPAIRAELLADPAAGRVAPLLGEDWPPTFEVDRYALPPRPTADRPMRIGRHGRDAVEKWLEDPDALRQAYPDDPAFEVSILGGAEIARRVLGGLPPNWTVLPFGSVDPRDYLAGLDAFVYFPHSRYLEAFGRVVVEAMMAGVPCVLSEMFRPTFGELALYREPAGVRGVLERLAADDARRVALARAVQARATALFSSDALRRRFPELGLGKGDGEEPPGAPLTPEILSLRAEIERG